MEKIPKYTQGVMAALSSAWISEYVCICVKVYLHITYCASHGVLSGCARIWNWHVIVDMWALMEWLPEIPAVYPQCPRCKLSPKHEAFFPASSLSRFGVWKPLALSQMSPMALPSSLRSSPMTSEVQLQCVIQCVYSPGVWLLPKWPHCPQWNGE